MSRRILAVERSPLAGKIYAMILSQIDDVELLTLEERDPLQMIEKNGVHCDLIIISHGSLGDRKKEMVTSLKKIFQRSKVPCLLLVKETSSPEWDQLAGFENVVKVSRPFSPEEFSTLIKKLWRIS